MRISDFDLYKELLAKKSGLVLSPDKSYMLDSRLTPIAKKWGYPTLDSMTLALRAVPSPAMVEDIVEAMTTNETSFFRDRKPFELFRDMVLPYLVKTRAKKRTLRVWCAGCSTGQEAWSIAMLVREFGPEINGWKIEILGTDLAAQNIAHARNGLYSQFEIQRGLSMAMALKYFTQSDAGWRAKEDIGKLVSFEHHNLLESPAALGKFSVVLCRNVLTGLDNDVQQAILTNIAGCLEPDGFLFLGHNEIVPEHADEFKPMEKPKGLYVLQEGSYNMDALTKATG